MGKTTASRRRWSLKATIPGRDLLTWPSSWSLFSLSSGLKRQAKRSSTADNSDRAEPSSDSGQEESGTRFIRSVVMDKVVFRILSAVEAVVVVSTLCFFLLCCGCHI